MKDWLGKYPKTFLALFATFVVLLILVAQASLWLHRTIYDTGRFTEIATQAVTEPSSRASVADTIVNEALKDRPLVRSTVGPRLSSLIAGLLGTDIAEGLFERIVERVQLLVTTPRRDPVVLDISGVKQAIVSVQSVISEPGRETRIDPDQLPNEIMLVDTTKLPNVHRLGVMLSWLGPLSLALALGLLAWWVLRVVPARRLHRLRFALLVLVLSSAVALLMGPLLKPPFLARAETAPAQTLMGNVYDGFIEPFNSQVITFGALALAGLVVTLLWRPFVRLATRPSSKPAPAKAKKTKKSR